MRPLAPKFALLAVALLLSELTAIRMLPEPGEGEEVASAEIPGSVSINTRVSEKAAPLKRLDSLEPCRRPGWSRSVVVRVVDSLGEPLAGVGLIYEEDDLYTTGIPGQEREVADRTNARGIAEFGVPPDATEITAIWPVEPSRIYVDYKSLRAKAALENDRCTIRMPFATASGHLRLRNGEPIVGGVIEANDKQGFWSQATTDPNGHFVIRVPESGKGDLNFGGLFAWRDYPRGWGLQDRSTVMESVQIRDVYPGSRDLLMLSNEFRTDGVLRVQVLDPEGRPVSGALVSGEGPDPYQTMCYSTSPDGRTRVGGLLVRPQRIEVRFQRGESWTGPWLKANTIEVVPDGQEVVVRVKAGTVLRGEVRGPSGERVVGARIRADCWGRGQSTTISDANGDFDFVMDPAAAPWALRSEWKDAAGLVWTGKCHVTAEDVGARQFLYLTDRPE